MTSQPRAASGGDVREAVRAPHAGSPRRPRVAILSYSSGEFDARSFRMARAAVGAGYHVTIYTRWEAELPPVEVHEGYRLVRVPADWRLAVPGLRGGAHPWP